MDLIKRYYFKKAVRKWAKHVRFERALAEFIHKASEALKAADQAEIALHVAAIDTFMPDYRRVNDMLCTERVHRLAARVHLAQRRSLEGKQSVRVI